MSTVVYHVAPRSRRRSIRREGLLRCSWCGGSLILWTYAKPEGVRRHAEMLPIGTDIYGDYDVWSGLICDDDIYYTCNDTIAVRNNIPPNKCMLLGYLGHYLEEYFA